jgi:snurportin-1
VDSPTQATQTQYQFSYPNTIIPVPYVTPTTYETLLHDVIPKAKRPTGLRVRIPAASDLNVPSPVVEEGSGVASPNSTLVVTPDVDMQVDTPTVIFKPHVAPSVLKEVEASITPDGILLYLTEAAYTPGTGPLSAWVPLEAYANPGEGNGQGKDDVSMQISPVDLFER